jgi:anti-sigma factor RsiW
METWLLEDYAEGLLGVAETTLLEAHLAVCEDCRRELSHIKLLFWELESMRREPVPVPEALDGLETAILDQWLAGRETWLQQTLYRGKKATRSIAEQIPRIPGADRAAALAGEASVRTAKWMGRKTFQLLRQKFHPAEAGRRLLSQLTGGGS